MTSHNLSLRSLRKQLKARPPKFTEDTSQKSLKIKINDDKSNEWEHWLGEGLAGNTSPKSFTLEINDFGDDNDESGRGLSCEDLARNTSLESLTIKIMGASFVSSKWEHTLGEGLAGITSLKSLTLDFDYCDNEYKYRIYQSEGGLGEGLARNTSLESLTSKMIKATLMSIEWELCLGEGLARNTSLKSLTLDFDCYDKEDKYGFRDDFYESGGGLGEGLARNTLLESLTFVIKNVYRGNEWGRVVGGSLAKTNSLNSLILTINNCCYINV